MNVMELKTLYNSKITYINNLAGMFLKHSFLNFNENFLGEACKKRTNRLETLPILLWFATTWKQSILIQSENRYFSRTVANVCNPQKPRVSWCLTSMINRRVQLLNLRHVVSLLVVATLHLNGFLTCSTIHDSHAVVPQVHFQSQKPSSCVSNSYFSLSLVNWIAIWVCVPSATALDPRHDLYCSLVRLGSHFLSWKWWKRSLSGARIILE